MRIFMRSDVQATDDRDGLTVTFGQLQLVGPSDPFFVCEVFTGSTLLLPADQQQMPVPVGTVLAIEGFCIEAEGLVDLWVTSPASGDPQMQLRPMTRRGQPVAKLSATASVPQLVLRSATAGVAVKVSCGVWGRNSGV